MALCAERLVKAMPSTVAYMFVIESMWATFCWRNSSTERGGAVSTSSDHTFMGGKKKYLPPGTVNDRVAGPKRHSALARKKTSPTGCPLVAEEPSMSSSGF